MSHRVISVVVDSDQWDGALAAGMLAVIPEVRSVPRRIVMAKGFTGTETEELHRMWDVVSDL
jgi:hypothetical protein